MQILYFLHQFYCLGLISVSGIKGDNIAPQLPTFAGSGFFMVDLYGLGANEKHGPEKAGVTLEVIVLSPS
jgi:hypothetical protein